MIQPYFEEAVGIGLGETEKREKTKYVNQFFHLQQHEFFF
jgi:hypothetical protein